MSIQARYSGLCIECGERWRTWRHMLIDHDGAVVA